AEDGIRDFHVTGVQTCALPIWGLALFAPRAPGDWLVVACDVGQGDAMLLRSAESSAVMIDTGTADGRAVECLRRYGVTRVDLLKIGRASGRERVYVWSAGGRMR